MPRRLLREAAAPRARLVRVRMVRGAEPLLISVAHLIHELLRYEWFLWGTPLHTANRTASTLADAGPETRPSASPDDASAGAARRKGRSPNFIGLDCAGNALPSEALAAFDALSDATDALRDATVLARGGRVGSAALALRQAGGRDLAGDDTPRPSTPFLSRAGGSRGRWASRPSASRRSGSRRPGAARSRPPARTTTEALCRMGGRSRRAISWSLALAASVSRRSTPRCSAAGWRSTRLLRTGRRRRRLQRAGRRRAEGRAVGRPTDGASRQE